MYGPVVSWNMVQVMVFLLLTPECMNVKREVMHFSLKVKFFSDTNQQVQMYSKSD